MLLWSLAKEFNRFMGENEFKEKESGVSYRELTSTAELFLMLASTKNKSYVSPDSVSIESLSDSIICQSPGAGGSEGTGEEDLFGNLLWKE